MKPHNKELMRQKAYTLTRYLLKQRDKTTDKKRQVEKDLDEVFYYSGNHILSMYSKEPE